jgi:hypothetical protein
MVLMLLMPMPMRGQKAATVPSALRNWDPAGVNPQIIARA